MKFRIKTNGTKFRIQEWSWFWPFWIYVKKHYEFGGWSYAEWSSREKAQMWIDGQLADHEYEQRKWTDA